MTRRCKKVRYRDKLSANIALLNIHLRDRPNRLDRPERRARFCQYCRGWHLTSKERV
jgi:hypothetical protein